MFLEVVRSEGLSHFSYVVGDGGKAAVIDPRRDCSIYLDIAHRSGARITHIFETHRNEDYLTGSKELSLLTAANVFHGGKTEFRFGNPTLEGDIFNLGHIRLTVLETPGHTPESISLVLTDTKYSPDPIAVFTGDSLLIGNTGRIDLFPGKLQESAGQLYDSIFNKLLPLGDHVLLYPSHGGEKASKAPDERFFSTLGLERRNNPILHQTSRDTFVSSKTHERNYFPRYYTLMLRQNLEGPPLMNGLPRPQPYPPQELAASMELDMFVVDTRSPEAVCGAYIPGTLAIPLEGLSLFAGLLIPYDRRIGLIVEEYTLVDTAVRYLIRVGFDTIHAYLAGDIYAWERNGRTYERIPTVRLSELERRKRSEQCIVIDVRSPEAYDTERLADTVNIFAGEIPERVDDIPRDRTAIVYSENGMLSVIAATFLRMNGIDRVEVGLGPLTACTTTGCELVTE